MRKVIPLLLTLSLLGAAPPALAQATEPFIGEVITIATQFCPAGWAPLNGQLLPISQNTALFSLLSTNFGGDGVQSFALPRAKPIFTANGATLTQCIALQGVYPAQN